MKQLPNGWGNTVLSQIMDFKNGLNFTKSNNGEAIKIVGVGDFKDLTELKSTENLDIVYVDNTIKNEELLKNGDLLLVRSNGNKELIGRCLFFPIVEERLSFSGFTIRGRVVNKGADAQFISNFMQSKILKQQIQKNSGGTNISNLSQEILNSINIMLPPLPEQTKIAQILGTWDKAIRTTEQLIANSEQQKQALMQQLLTGKKRLLNDDGERFCGEWDEAHLNNLLSEVRLRNQNENIQRVLSVTNHSGFVLPEEQFSKRVASENVSNYKVVKQGQFAYNPSRLNVGSFARLDKFSDGILSPMYVVFSVQSNLLDSDFFLHWMQSHEVNQRIKNSTQGSVRESVGFDAFCSFPFRLPIMEEQQKIAAVLTAADNETETLKQTLCRLKTEKQALMQQLLTGKLRVQVKAA
ncbi:restriction endonuclease subunit S [Paralysiella testudinis]|uniref:Restriction endonuclease subunit S n=1 Tax=Paralysiella testudinis TaxID=2809020 RepID=A0A892ZDJ2_9NEIS|nr:restriction endonuclease subunit S [Paralysiella testudinis]QRQ81405.1 restriction endonuclease subunit S [Paralysiella testudinis]